MNDAPSGMTIAEEGSTYRALVDALVNRAFGPGRYARAAERLREGNHAFDELCLVALEGGDLRASVRLWPIEVGAAPALLLGPLAVDPAHAGRGFGRALMKAALDRARQRGHRLCFLVGDLPYYAKVGFERVPRGRVTLPGPVDPDRVLVCELVPGAFDGVAGTLSPPRNAVSA